MKGGDFARNVSNNIMGEKILNLKIKDLVPGMIIGKTIIDSKTGTVLIKKGQKLLPIDISRLKQYFEKNDENISTIEESNIFKFSTGEKYLPSKSSKHVNKIINEETQQQAMIVMENVMKDAALDGNIDTKEVEGSIINIIDNILENENAAINLLNIKDFDDYTYTHSVNVATVSIFIGTKLGLSKKDITDLGMGAFLHDIGKIKIPIEILNKPGKLTDEEFKIMKLHPAYTYKIIEEKSEVSNVVKMIAAQHHEKFDGTGYPFGLKGDKINYLARIVAIADVYDALTTDRVYRKAMLPYEAMKIIISGSKTHFDDSIVKVFLQGLSLYPTGSAVILNTGETAVIKEVNEKQIVRPVIVIIKDKWGKKIIEPVKVKLIDDKTRYIVGAAKIDE